MSLSRTSKPDSPQVLESIALPRSGQAVPGPLHTIVIDLEGNLYYSDELNHSVVSLDADGCVRWQRTKHGSALGEFSYPRGLSLGWIKKGEESLRCLAVCDAWNWRVQFLDLAGNPLEAWSKVGKSPFAEVSDVRFMAGDFNPDGAAKFTSFWLILDQGNHRLCAFDLDGNLLFQIGRCFPPSMETRWAIPGLFLERDIEHPGLIKSFSPFDYTFYPERILGDSENALYIWEPFSRRLKQVLLGNLLPVRIPCEKRLEWISADESSLLGWQKEENRLLLFNNTGELRQEIAIQGTPISTHNSPCELWVQAQDHLERWTRGTANPVSLEPRLLGTYTPLLRTALAEIDQLEAAKAQSAIAGWVAVADEGLALADEILELGREDADLGRLHRALENLHSLPLRRAAAEQVLCETFHNFCIGTLECHLAGSSGEEPVNTIAHAREQWDVFFAPIQNEFSKIQIRIDDLFMRRLTLSQEATRDRSRVESWMQAALAMEADLQKVLEWIYRWSGVVEGTMELLPLPWLLPLPEVLRDKARAPGHVAYRRSPNSYTPAPSCLREVGRIPLDIGQLTAVHPHCLAFSLEGDLLVSLNRGHQILQLDCKGKIIRRIGKPGRAAAEFQGPAGISVDSQGRLWVVDSENQRVQIVDLENGDVHVVSSRSSLPWLVCHPFGIGPMSDRSMLITDSGDRMVRIRPEGTWEVFSDTAGKGLGEFRHPTQLSPGIQGTLWIVDQRNHRVQKLDAEGRWVQEIGGCGLDHARLFFPESVAQFEDGVVAVAQNRWNRCIKLYTPDGIEFDRTVLTYFAEGMLVRGGRLFVAAMDIDSILVYERESVL